MHPCPYDWPLIYELVYELKINGFDFNLCQLTPDYGVTCLLQGLSERLIYSQCPALLSGIRRCYCMMLRSPDCRHPIYTVYLCDHLEFALRFLRLFLAVYSLSWSWAPPEEDPSAESALSSRVMLDVGVYEL